MASLREPPPAPVRAPGTRRISARVASVNPSATLAVDAKAKALQAAGEDVIGFGAGEPDFPTPAHIVEAAVAACGRSANHHYTATAGLADLRQAIAAKTLRDSGLEAAPGQVVVTNGAKQAVYETFAALVDPGDEVLVPAPFWTTYPEAIALAGGIPVAVPTTEESGFHLTVEALEAHRTPATKVLLFVSPNNPTGAVSSRAEVEAIGQWAVEHGLWVVTDEIYEHLVYGDRSFTSMPVVVPELMDRCVVINGVAKTYAMTGWRVGWLIAPADVAGAVSNLQSHSCGNVDNVAQEAALAAVAGDLSAVAEMRTVFDQRRRTMHRMLNECRGVTCVEPEGAFYAFPSVKGLYGARLGGREIRSSLDVVEAAIEEVKVAVVPGEAFGAPGYLRLSYALGDEAMVEGVSRLAALFATAA
ncbi:MAG TPA: pyridoxal phosphate-dependent aminotransferase [Acidimicrobiales bacterium]|nr:pyridoxal phosphate-dependent aminotransferase [Acidimicrobiales bacterium]